MSQLDKLDLRKKIIEYSEKGMPILGICLGMQILSDYGSENNNSKGLGLIKGNVEILKEVPINFLISDGILLNSKIKKINFLLIYWMKEIFILFIVIISNVKINKIF